MGSTGQYRPPQWANGPAMVSITQTPTQGQSNTSGTADPNVPGGFLIGGSGSTQTTYVFDAVLELEHEQRLEKTHHPVQTGADISSHAYLMPARLAMSVGMSDVMAAYSSGAQQQAGNGSAVGTSSATPGTVSPFTGSPSKSVSAYQTMLGLQAARQPLTVTTRLRTYTNMVITSIAPREDFKTITGLRMRIEFEQILTGSVTSSPVTARPDSTQSTGLGTVNPDPVPAPTQNQFQIPQAQQITVPVMAPPTPYTSPVNDQMTDYLSTANVPGAGSYSSVPGQQGLP